MRFQVAAKPTLYFIGVSTAASSIMRVFPAWAAHLGLGDAVLAGIDFPLRAEPARYHEAVSFLKADPLSLGALVTTHKLDLFAACRDLFDEIDPHARLMAETSCLSKRDGRLIAHAKDPLSSGLAIDGFLAPDHFARTAAEVFAMGAGGATIAFTWHLMQGRGGDRPSRIVVSDLSEPRLDHIRAIHERIGSGVPVDYLPARALADNDSVLRSLRPGSLVVNATGLGKDAPGSPLTDAAIFPERAVAWELNYRGDLVFLAQARAQAAARGLRVEDGWSYFVHGWARVIAEVFDVAVPTTGPGFAALARIAAEASGRAA
jgi:shikimate 5-dehydrogenase